MMKLSKMNENSVHCPHLHFFIILKKLNTGFHSDFLIDQVLFIKGVPKSTMR